MPDTPKPTTIIFTIHPPKKGKRAITVSGAPEGEMPLFLSGQFADRHALLDQAFAELLKRKPQLVKVAVDKKVAVKAKSVSPAVGDAPEEETDSPDTETESVDEATHDSPAPQACRVCGCTETTPCEGGCAWIEPDLCSACADKDEPDQLVRPEQPELPIIAGDAPPR